MSSPTCMSRPAGLLLIAAAAGNFAGVVLFSMRDGVNGGAPPSHAYLVAERGLFAAGMVVSALGFCLLDDLSVRGSALMRAGALGYFAAAAVGVVAETLQLSHLEAYPTTVAYVVLAFFGQAVIGAALALGELVPAWLGWLTMVWNLGWLVGLSLASPDDVYYPVLHLMMPILIGIALLRSTRRRSGRLPARTRAPSSPP
jgi:hypothetical protein